MTKLKILVLAQNYPSDDKPFVQAFIHTRLKCYPVNFEITVLNFSTKVDYIFEGVRVICEASFLKDVRLYDIVISHAPNLRNHIRFLALNLFSYRSIIFTFHGHEVIDLVRRIYSQKTIHRFPKALSLKFKAYNMIKLPILRLSLKILNKLKKSHFIFVSKTLFDEAVTDLKEKSLFKLGYNTSIIYNPINPSFYEKIEIPEPLKGDFICIRPFDEPKYGVDIYIELAIRNPSYDFHLFGQGSLPNTKIPNNLKISYGFIHPDKLPKLLKGFKVAILPTRWDSQGVLACEITAMGMPLLTSKLSVCEEFLESFSNVKLISNDIFHKIEVSTLFSIPNSPPLKILTSETTSQREINLIQDFISKIK
jgi:hypothetical protein